MVENFYQDHEGLMRWLEEDMGYLYNDFGGTNPDDKKIHRSDCPMIHAGRGDIANVRKIVSRNLDELVKWVVDHRGGKGSGYILCLPCVNSGRLPSDIGQLIDKSKLLERIVADPRVMVGKPVIRGTRLTVQFILGLLAQGLSMEEILQEYEGLTREDILACLLFAKESLENTDFAPLAVEGD